MKFTKQLAAVGIVLSFTCLIHSGCSNSSESKTESDTSTTQGADTSNRIQPDLPSMTQDTLEKDTTRTGQTPPPR